MPFVVETKRAIKEEDACGFPPGTEELERLAGDANDVLAPNTAFHAVVTKVASLWDNGSTITYSFFGGTEHKKKVVDDTIPEWTRYAHLALQRLGDNHTGAMVRIGFDPKNGSKSLVGKAALLRKGDVTMNLGRLADSAVVSDKDRGTILHEWGHALGMKHEHQSPAREGVITFKEDAARKYYGKPEPRLQSQVFKMLELEDISNFSALDTSSIMMYSMPDYINEQGIAVTKNTKLSDMDKAYMLINYPHPERNPRGSKYSLKWALDTAGVPPREQKEILAMKNADEIRIYFATWCKDTRAKELAKRKSGTTRPTTSAASKPPKGTQHGLFSGVSGMLNHPAFHEAISNVVNAALSQRGLSPHVSPGIWSEEIDASYDTQQDLLSTGAVPPGVWFEHGLSAPSGAQHGLLSITMSILRHPAFHKAVSTVVDTALVQRGVRPGSNAPIDVQQGLIHSLSGLGHDPRHVAGVTQYSNIQRGLGQQFNSTLGQQITSTLGQDFSTVNQRVDSTIGQGFQRRINSITPAGMSSADVQQGLLSGIASLFGLGLNPQQVAAMPRHHSNIQQGLGPTPPVATQYSDIQQGLFPGIVNVLKQPASQKVVHTTVNSAFTQKGINPSAGAALSANIQQGLLSDIGSLFGLGLNPQAEIAPSYAALPTRSQFGNGALAYSDTGAKASVAGAGNDEFGGALYTAMQSVFAQHGLQDPSVDAVRHFGNTANFVGA